MRTGWIAVMTLVLSTNAAAAPKGCLTREEAEAAVKVMLPPLITAVTAKCGPVASGSFLRTNGASLANGYRAAATAAYPTARGALTRVADPMMNKLLGDPASGQVMLDTIAEGVVEKLKPQDCDTVDRLVKSLAPLPAQNLATMFETILEASTEGKATKDLSICPRPPRQ